MPFFGAAGLTRIHKINTEIYRKHVRHKQKSKPPKFGSTQESPKEMSLERKINISKNKVETEGSDIIPTSDVYFLYNLDPDIS